MNQNQLIVCIVVLRQFFPQIIWGDLLSQIIWGYLLSQIISCDLLSQIIWAYLLSQITSCNLLSQIIWGYLLSQIISYDLLSQIIWGYLLSQIIWGDKQGKSEVGASCIRVNILCIVKWGRDADWSQNSLHSAVDHNVQHDNTMMHKKNKNALFSMWFSSLLHFVKSQQCAAVCKYRLEVAKSFPGRWRTSQPSRW